MDGSSGADLEKVTSNSEIGQTGALLSHLKIGARQRQLLDSFLDISGPPRDKLRGFQRVRQPGTCEWLAQKSSFVKWLNDPRSRIYWLLGKPGVGKSVLSGYVVDHLQNLGSLQAFYFFSYMDRSGSTISYFLRSVVWQMSCLYPEILEAVFAVCAKDEAVCQRPYSIIWRRLFVDGILKVKLERPLFLVIDAVDECKATSELLPLLLRITETGDIHIFITSRETFEQSNLGRGFRIKESEVCLEEIKMDDTKSDILLYVQANIHRFPQIPLAKVIEKSAGSFLWVSLVLEELLQANTDYDMVKIFEEVPSDMDGLYSRVLDSMSQNPRGKLLTKAFLIWIVCSTRPLTLRELREAVQIDIQDSIVDVERSIQLLCRQLITIDDQRPRRVDIVHHTARSYLLQHDDTSEFGINGEVGHRRLATACLKFLSGPDMRRLGAQGSRRLRSRQEIADASPFAEYACKSLHKHLAFVSPTDDEFLSLLAEFFNSANVLGWIEHVALYSDHNDLSYTGRALNQYLLRRSRYLPPFGRGISILHMWAMDLGRLVAKFGRSLKSSPSSIFTHIPAFCPPESAIGKQLVSKRGFSIVGLSSSTWDDCLSTIFYQHQKTTALAHSVNHFAVGLSNGRVIVYDATTYQEDRSFSHGEMIRNIIFSTNGGVLATAGQTMVRMRDIETWHELWSFKTTCECISLSFAGLDKLLMAITRENDLIIWDLETGQSTQDSINITSARDDQQTPHLMKPLTTAAFCEASDLGKCLAVASRHGDIVLWDLESAEIFQTLNRPMQTVIALEFSPTHGLNLLAASYLDGTVVVFDTMSGDAMAETQAGGHALAVSPNGRILAAGDTYGTLQLLDFETLRHLYRITSEPAAIRSLKFSSDSQRLVDVRETQCRVWNPAVLSRQSDNSYDEESDDTVSVSTRPEDLSMDMRAEECLITCLSSSEIYPVIFCGKDDGTVAVYSSETGAQQAKLFNAGSFTSVLSLHYNDQLGILTTVDSSSRVTSRRLLLEQVEWKVEEIVFDHTPGHAVKQVIANEDHTRVLLSLKDRDELLVVSPEDQKLAKTLYWSDRKAHRWASHPVHKDQLILIQGNVARLYDWQTLNELTDSGEIFLEGRALPDLFIRSVSPGFNNEFITMMFSERPAVRSRQRLLLFRTADFTPSSTYAAPDPAFHLLTEQVELIVGIHRSRLIFLHSNGWICSTVPETGNRSFVRHFPTPADWLWTSNELLVQVRESGDVVFVKRDEIAVIKGGLDMTSI